jgi:hypothetical protein
MSVTAIRVNGTALNLADVAYAVTVSHGRNDVTASPEPGLAQLDLLITGDAAIPVTLGDTLEVDAYNTTRFTGTVSDMALEHMPPVGENSPMTRLTITGIGPLARLGRLYAGAAGFPAEDLDVRVAAILDTTGLTYIAETDPDIALNAYDPNYDTVSSLLAELCEWTGATVYDMPDGSIRFESYTRRGYDYSTAIWSDYLTETWPDLLGTWANQTSPGSAAPTPVALPADGVVWEPTWQTTANTILNDVTVTYGTADPQLTQQVTDTASIALFDRRAVELTTGLANDYDATRRAQLVITSQAAERWQLGQVTVLLDQLTAGQRTSVLGLREGARVLLTNLPEPNPQNTDQFVGVVEGWTDQYVDGFHTTTISLSDPRYSYAVISWGEAPATATWGGVSVTKTWADIILPADLE